MNVYKPFIKADSEVVPKTFCQTKYTFESAALGKNVR